jgi:hypothetical protein
LRTDQGWKNPFPRTWAFELIPADVETEARTFPRGFGSFVLYAMRIWEGFVCARFAGCDFVFLVCLDNFAAKKFKKGNYEIRNHAIGRAVT